MAKPIPAHIGLHRFVPAVGDNLEEFNPWQYGITEEGVRHSVRSYAEQLGNGDFGTFIPRLHLLYERANTQFFGGKLPRDPLFTIGQCPGPVFGWYTRQSSIGGRFEIGLSRKLFRGGGCIIRDEKTETGFARFVDDIVRHEMVHAHCNEVLKEPENSFHGHGPVFAYECNRIGKTLQLPIVRSCRARGKAARDIPSCAQWPQCVRPEGYYEGAYVPDESRDDEDEVDPRDKALAYLRRFLEHGGPTPGHLQLAGQAAVIACRLALGREILSEYSTEIPLSDTIVI